jgi:multidrug efflux system membrane fusion protein
MPENVIETIESNHEPAKRPSSGHWWLWFIVLCALAAGAFVYWKRQQHKPVHYAPPTPVVTAPARKGDMNVYLTGLGSVTPLDNVTVHTRVDGQLMEVNFREGQDVTRDSLLAVIDPRPFEVQLTQAEGQMARDQAQLNNARVDLERYRLLWKQDSIPKQELDTQESLVRQLEGAVKLDQGQIDSAKLQLVYCRITAPISGRIGLRLVDPGNIVHAADAGGMLTIVQMEPIAVIFPIPEDSLPQVLRKMKGGRLAVSAFDREMKQELAQGELATVDNQIDPTTGTVKLKALFSNKDNELFPNQFVNARLLVDVKKDVIIVPSAAILRNPQGDFVFVLQPDQTAAMRPVKIGINQEGDTSIAEGLDVGEQVIVEGAENLRNGSKVEVKDSESNKNDGKKRGGKGAAPAGEQDKQHHGPAQ